MQKFSHVAEIYTEVAVRYFLTHPVYAVSNSFSVHAIWC